MRWQLLGSFGLIILIALGTVALVARYTTQQEVVTFLGHGGQVGLENLANDLESYYAEHGAWAGIGSLTGGNPNAGAGGPGRGQGPRGNKPGGNPSVGNAGNNHILVDPNGKVVFSPNSEDIGTQYPEPALTQAIPLEVSGELIGYLLPENGLPALPDNFESLLIERVNRASLLAALISGGIAIVLALILATWILRPVHSLTRAAGRLSEGDFSQRVAIHGGSELAALGDTFNQMAGSLEEATARRQALTADIAHELRNPLAIQSAHLEALQDGVYPLTLENLTMIAEQNHQLTRLVDDLRTLALADAGELSLNHRPVDLSLICSEMATRFQPQADVKKIQLRTFVDATRVQILGDRERLQQILDNLMQNALRFTPEEGWIDFSLQRQGNTAIVSIHNSGRSLSEDVAAHLFERFYRGDKARDRASGGAGLGLAIARKLAEAHGGTLVGKNHPSGGVVFILALPTI